MDPEIALNYLKNLEDILFLKYLSEKWGISCL